MNEMSGVNVKVERGSTKFYVTRDFSNFTYILFTRVNFSRQGGGFPLTPLGWISTVA